MKKITVLVITSALLLNFTAYSREGGFIKELNILFLKGSYEDVIKEGTGGLSQRRLAGKEKKETLYLIGTSYVKLGFFSEARESFEKMLKISGKDFTEEGQIGIADSYFYEKNYQKAIETYKKVVNVYPRSERLSSVYHNLALSYKARKDFDKANFYFDKVKNKYAASFEANKATYISDEKTSRFYILQLGAFGSLKNAKKLVRRLKRKKYDCYIMKDKDPGRVLFKVRAGKFASESRAMKLVRRLRRDRFTVKVIIE